MVTGPEYSVAAELRTVVAVQRTIVALSGGFHTFVVNDLTKINTELSGDPKIALVANISGFLPVLASGAANFGVTSISGPAAYGISGNSFPVALYATTSGGGLSGINSLATGTGTSGVPITAIVEGW